VKRTDITFEDTAIRLISVNTLIVGSGAAALAAAVNLHDLGQEDLAIVTEQWGGGTSNNAGSDKQTYYKLSLAGDAADSPLQMAEDLFSGGSMHGDIALCEAQNSARAFLNLVNLGVPFPHDSHGGFVGYQTDHDQRGRATSAGPRTSQMMFTALAAAVGKRGLEVFDSCQVISLLTEPEGVGSKVIGALALDLAASGTGTSPYILFNAPNIILGTGGPGGIYEASVYPESQIGSTGLALEAGAVAQNLTESQFGLASISFRWNLSGSYQQVIPRYFSTDADGGDEHEFLNAFFPNPGRLATAIFLKGYEWPFDPRKVRDHGSSLIDLLVYRERVMKGRRVFLDYRRNPTGPAGSGEFTLDVLAPEAKEYLERSGSVQETPIDRLRKMNPPAIQLYLDNAIDLAEEPLEIAVCAQHNNGGLRGDVWWESNVRHLFPVGEVNGTHGVRRPGGSALNAGQVGALRAAQYISRRYAGEPPAGEAFLTSAGPKLSELLSVARRFTGPAGDDPLEVKTTAREIRQRMSRVGAHIRNPDGIDQSVEDAWRLCDDLRERLRVESTADLPSAFRNLDLGLTHAVYLEAIAEYLARGGRSRGSFLVLDRAGELPCEGLEDVWRFLVEEEGSFVDGHILEVQLDQGGRARREWVDIRPVPREDPWFEQVWEAWRNDDVIR